MSKPRKGVVEEGGAIAIAMILVILAIAIFLIVIIPFLSKLTLK
jgi:competence protein ComGC